MKVGEVSQVEVSLSRKEAKELLEVIDSIDWESLPQSHQQVTSDFFLGLDDIGISTTERLTGVTLLETALVAAGITEEELY